MRPPQESSPTGRTTHSKKTASWSPDSFQTANIVTIHGSSRVPGRDGHRSMIQAKRGTVSSTRSLEVSGRVPTAQIMTGELFYRGKDRFGILCEVRGAVWIELHAESS